MGGTRGLSQTGLIRETWNVGWIFMDRGKLKTSRLCVDNTSDGKWPNKLGAQLAVLQLEGQVTGGEPDPLADLVGGSRCAVLVGGSSIAVSGLEESSALAAVNKGLCRWAGCLPLLFGK